MKDKYPALNFISNLYRAYAIIIFSGGIVYAVIFASNNRADILTNILIAILIIFVTTFASIGLFSISEVIDLNKEISLNLNYLNETVWKIKNVLCENKDTEKDTVETSFDSKSTWKQYQNDL